MKEITRKQLSILEGIAYWIADRAWFIERNGTEDPDFQKYDSTIRSLLNEADAEKISWAAQNTVIVWAEDWRREQSQYITNMLEKRGFKINYAA